LILLYFEVFFLEETQRQQRLKQYNILLTWRKNIPYIVCISKMILFKIMIFFCKKKPPNF